MARCHHCSKNGSKAIAALEAAAEEAARAEYLWMEMLVARERLVVARSDDARHQLE